MVPVDYHHTDEGRVLMALLGTIVLDWNYLEHQVSVAIWHYTGDFDRGMTFTSTMGNVTRADTLLRLARQSETNPEILSRYEFATRAFNTLRQNRNALVHSMTIQEPNENSKKPEWRRASKNAPPSHAAVLADLADLLELYNNINMLSDFLLRLYIHNSHDEKKATGQRVLLPETFPLPRKLTQPPPEAPKKNDSPQPQS